MSTQQQTIHECEARLEAARVELEKARKVEADRVEALGRAHAAGIETRTRREALREARETREMIEASLPHLEQAIKDARFTIVADERQAQRERLAAAVAGRLTLAEQIDLLADELATLLGRSQQLGSQTVGLAKTLGYSGASVGNDVVIKYWLAGKLRGIVSDLPSSIPTGYLRPLAELEAEACGRVR